MVGGRCPNDKDQKNSPMSGAIADAPGYEFTPKVESTNRNVL